MRVAVLAVVVATLAAGCTVENPFSREDPPLSVVYRALRFETTAGAFTAILYPQEAPETVAFLEALVEKGYYDGREFNRVIPGFVIQEVDRLGGATDHPGRVGLEAGTRVMFSAGALGIARGESPDSGGSEFFVMDFAHSHLYGNYTAFAQVVEGLDVVHAIARVETVENPAPGLPLPPPLYAHDRVAVDPVRITRAARTTVEIPFDAAPRYPLQVAPTVRGEGVRYTLEYPADLAPGRHSNLTWYVYTSPEAPPPPLTGATVRWEGPGGNGTIPVAHDPADARILHFDWAPDGPGNHTLVLRRAGADLAGAHLAVASRT